MGHALLSLTDEEFRIAAVREILQDIHELALQSQLLALNSVVESAQSGPADALTEQVQQALSEASRVTSAVDVLLQQINASSHSARH